MITQEYQLNVAALAARYKLPVDIVQQVVNKLGVDEAENFIRLIHNTPVNLLDALEMLPQ